MIIDAAWQELSLSFVSCLGGPVMFVDDRLHATVSEGWTTMSND